MHHVDRTGAAAPDQLTTPSRHARVLRCSFTWSDFALCKWPAHLLEPGDTITGMYPAGVAAELARRNEPSISKVNTALRRGVGDAVLSFSHFLPREETLPDWCAAVVAPHTRSRKSSQPPPPPRPPCFTQAGSLMPQLPERVARSSRFQHRRQVLPRGGLAPYRAAAPPTLRRRVCAAGRHWQL